MIVGAHLEVLVDLGEVFVDVVRQGAPVPAEAARRPRQERRQLAPQQPARLPTASPPPPFPLCAQAPTLPQSP